MNPLDERLNDHLEQLVQNSGHDGHQASGFTGPAPERTPEIEDLVVLAQRLQSAPQLQVAPDFANQLERRLLRRHVELRLQSRKRRSPFVLLRARPLLSAALGLCVLFCLLSTSLLAWAAQVSNPTNPLYALKRWEQHVQVQFASSPAAQATLDLQFAHEQLNALASLADPARAEAYHEGLLDLDQQLRSASSLIHGLPAGSQHDQLAGEFADLQARAIHELRGFLPRLDLPERLATTDALGRLGDTVPTLSHATLTLPAHPNGQATIILAGSDLQVGAQLLVNGRVVEASETVQPGQAIFVVNWRGGQHPQSLGILNLDGTAVQTTAITITSATNGNQNSNGNEPSSTPTPHGNKPPVTPTPRGNPPPVIPTPHH